MAEYTYFPALPADIVDQAAGYARKGYRLIQIHCTNTPQEMFIIYTFEKEDLTCESLRMEVQVGDTVPSISGDFFGAFLYENEIHDLYGVNFSGMAVDFKGTFYETAVKQAFSMTNTENNI
ncbi:NADH-quinone oxidoreductase subunit C [Dehalobacter sp. DCM]|uniref:NADH-quinone oxidoreductase subunit C n=1 Tax=Dehalobacter sp. DCM TaxID=2907827 RepID=UPI003081C5E7|nr:NADH-quinone oxidoreductase subunit C [Dehalobacter sp. DCM]